MRHLYSEDFIYSCSEFSKCHANIHIREQMFRLQFHIARDPLVLQVDQLHSILQHRPLSESDWHCRTEWGWLARLEIPNVDMSINYVIDKSESVK